MLSMHTYRLRSVYKTQHIIEYVDIENCKSPSDFGWNFIQMISIKFQWVFWSPSKMPKWQYQTKMMASMLNGFSFSYVLCDMTRGDANTRNEENGEKISLADKHKKI